MPVGGRHSLSARGIVCLHFFTPTKRGLTLSRPCHRFTFSKAYSFWNKGQYNSCPEKIFDPFFYKYGRPNFSLTEKTYILFHSICRLCHIHPYQTVFFPKLWPFVPGFVPFSDKLKKSVCKEKITKYRHYEKIKGFLIQFLIWFDVISGFKTLFISPYKPGM